MLLPWMDELACLPAQCDDIITHISISHYDNASFLTIPAVQVLETVPPQNSRNNIPQTYEYYQYTPLDLNKRTIRLLEIWPLDGDSLDTIIKTSLRLVELVAESYVCLSYTWGTELHDEPIMVNGQPFRIYENAWLFLSALRDKGLRCPVWIDVVCIDQHNVSERNHQVYLMADIYRTASDVIVWLGPSNRHQGELLNALGGNDQPFDYKKSSNELSLLLRDTSNQAERISLLDEWHWQAFRQLCHNSYWTRLWIVQEVMLARHVLVLWGKSCIEWELLTTFCETTIVADANTLKIGEKQRAPVNLIRNVVGLTRDHLGYFTLATTAAIFADQVCRDLRDHVYGVLGLIEGGNAFAVDYEEDALGLYMRVIEHEAFRHDLCAMRDRSSVPSSTTLMSALGLRDANMVVPSIIVHGAAVMHDTLSLKNYADITDSLAELVPNATQHSLDMWVHRITPIEDLSEEPSRVSSRPQWIDRTRDQDGDTSYRPQRVPRVPCFSCFQLCKLVATRRKPAIFIQHPKDPSHVFRWSAGPPALLPGTNAIIARASFTSGGWLVLDAIFSEAAPWQYQIMLRRTWTSTPEDTGRSKLVRLEMWTFTLCFDEVCPCRREAAVAPPRMRLRPHMQAWLEYDHLRLDATWRPIGPHPQGSPILSEYDAKDTEKEHEDEVFREALRSWDLEETMGVFE